MTGATHAKLRITRNGLAALALVLSVASSVAAQSITDARRVEFTPSPDHNAIDPTAGIPLVNNYTLDVFLAGTATPLQTANLGKPTPEADGMIRVDFVALLANPLTPGVIYEAVVSAVGPGGAAATPRSNTFSFSPPCPPVITPTSQSFTTSGGTGSTSVIADAVCAWTAVSNDSWITVTAGAAGVGSGTVTFSVASNGSITSRTGTLTIGTNTFTVTEAGLPCTYTISPTSQTFTSTGGSGTVTVTTLAGCTWTATSGSSWVTITNGGTRTDSGSVGFTVASNSSTQSRTATLTIAGRSFTVTEQGAPCTYTVSPLSVTVVPSGGTGTINVTTSSTCSWTSSASGTSWITLTGARTGSGTASYTVAPNSGTTTRNATVTVAGVSVTFAQVSPTGPAAPSNLRIIK